MFKFVVCISLNGNNQNTIVERERLSGNGAMYAKAQC